jgi:hypothetical protein
MSAQTPGANAPAPVSRSIQGAPSLSRVVHELWERADDRLSPDELEWFSEALTRAEFVCGNLEKMLVDIDCLVLENGKTDGTYWTFQAPDEFFTLMCVTAETVDNIRALIEIGDSAAYRLLHPELFPRSSKDNPRERA